MPEIIPEWALTEADDREIAALLARCYRTDFGGRSYFQTRQHLRIVHRDGAIVAHMALQLRTMRLAGEVLTVAGLADVATDPAYRGQGLAGRLLQEAIALSRQGPASFMALFGTAGLYAAAGFRKVGNPLLWCEMRGAVTGQILREPSRNLMVLPLRDREWDETAELDVLGNLF